MPTKSQTDIIEAYVAAFTTLDVDNMDTLLRLVDDDVHFTDPFNDVRGKAGFCAIFAHMFKTCDEPHFTVTDIAYSDQFTYLRWDMTARLKSWPRSALFLSGMSEIHIGENGLITAHIDHWDSASQLLAKLPIINVVMRPILRRFRIPV